MNTHLDYRPDDEERLMNVKEIQEISNHYAPIPAIVCGDFNALPCSQTVESMKQNFVDTWELVGQGDGMTFPSESPVRRIDYVFAARIADHPSSVLQPLSAHTIGSLASDHLPLVVDFGFT
jgi:endonuclease/exonuclease/phosphatase (EEP) superfamily protein YafD